VYVGNLSYDVKYRDLIEFMRGGGWRRSSGLVLLPFMVMVVVPAATAAVVAVGRLLGKESLPWRGWELKPGPDPERG
jgi:hypothetical protein